jgi:hypothetical protein
MPKESIFSDFTNLYSLTKTLRFELIPDENTKKFLSEIIPIDEKRAKYYKDSMKPMLDTLHNDFISESMKLVELNNETLKITQAIYNELKIKNKDRRGNESEIKKLEQQIATSKEVLRKQIVQSYQKCASQWKEKYPKLKQNDYKILTEAGVIDILREKNNDNDENLQAIKSFDRFWTYFSGFNQNRLNYYTSESKATGIANRCIDENLFRFFDNIELFTRIKKENEKLVSLYTDNFTVENYSAYLNQVGLDVYNEKCIAPLNSLISELNKQNQLKLPYLKLLYKQIGSDKKTFEMFEIENGNEWSELQNLVNNQNRDWDIGKSANIKSIVLMFLDFFKRTNDYNLNNIYFHKSSINTISNKWFKNWETLGKLLKEEKIGNVKFTGGEYKIPKLISLAELKELLENYKHIETDVDGSKGSLLFRGGRGGEYKENNLIVDSAWQTLLNIWQHEINKIFSEIIKCEKDFELGKNAKFEKTDSNIELIKNLCDAYLGLQQMIKLNILKGEGVEDTFYSQIDLFLKDSELDNYYNGFRNYLSKKPFITDKVKLNFDNSTLLDGWDLNKEKDNTSIILRKDGQYELVILNTKFNYIFDKKNKYHNPKIFQDDGNRLEKMEYKLLPGPNKMLPKVAFSKKNIDTFNPSSEILRIYEDGTFKKGDAFNPADLAKMIDFWKHVLTTHIEWKEFKMVFKDSGEYDGIDKFYADVAQQGYKINFDTKVNEDTLNELVEQGKCYRFKIHNKDWQQYSHQGGTKNLHTIYFENLFSKINLKNQAGICLKLNGEGEIFRRPASIEKKQKNSLVKGKTEEKVYENNRYTEGKLFFHFPITMNFCSENLNSVSKFNEMVYKTIKENPEEVCFIGIDQGEKHLLYYTVVDSKGNILEQNSLNRIETERLQDEKEVTFNLVNGEYKNVQLICTGNKVNYCNYHVLLDYYEKKRYEARQSWQEIGNIKELKKGYLSQVINKIYSLMIKYNAFVVMEDLTSGVTNRRFKIEKAVYKKFEQDLAKKLNHLILKNVTTKNGSVLKAYQLTPQLGAGDITIFERSKQWGTLFYVNPSYTSALDPITGWRKKKYIKNTDSIEKIKELFDLETGVNIEFDTVHKCFTFAYKDDDLDKTWKLFAHKELERFSWDPKNRENTKVNVHENFDKLFSQIKNRSGSLNQELLDTPDFDWKCLIRNWNYLNEIRNTDENKDADDNDFIQSPVWSDKIDGLYDSRKIERIGKNGENSNLPLNGDANGAYNIARKGLVLLERIKNSDSKPDLFVANTDWDGFVVNQKPKLSSFFASTDKII